MGFPTRLLLDGEKVVLDLRPHWWFYVGPAAAGVPVLLFVAGWFSMDDGDAKDILKWVCLAVFLAWLVWFGSRLVQWATTHFVVTTERLIFRNGLVAKHGRDVPLDRVNDISSHQSILERILRSGDLLIESAGEQGQQRFSNIRRPEYVKKEIYKQVEEHDERERFGGPAQRQSGGSIPDQIAALADLFERGHISEAEFAAKKADLLNRM
ncbi:MAG TPA: PH domain-containing protein [Sporichthya sp.]|jgi:uncharacterized membrane protein YdbT with pleckstrin-like domain|nr:PH domain-containing protein [Sporichthya sp.]